MVYVGANDGFLHAFDASTGNEDWAFMPSAVLPNLYELANTSYGHRYYVDGVLTVGDVYVGIVLFGDSVLIASPLSFDKDTQKEVIDYYGAIVTGKQIGRAHV